MRSSWETVETKSDFICSTARSSEMSRKAKIRPATAPAGSVMTASLSESQTSSEPRRIGTSRLRPPVGPSVSSDRPSTFVGGRPSASPAGTPVIRSAAWFQRTTSPSRSTATMPSATLPRIASLRCCSCLTPW